uniref:Importin N-terminal domain-containing protein n=1 Tax=Macrostomum lignano TaxID=282301 RepID=A0A1I8F6J3_9PLAT
MRSILKLLTGCLAADQDLQEPDDTGTGTDCSQRVTGDLLVDTGDQDVRARLHHRLLCFPVRLPMRQQQRLFRSEAGMLNSGSLAAWCSSVVNQGHVPRLEELESMQSSPNFVAELLPIIAEHPSNEVRLLASICIKNLVRLRWRFKVTPEDKSLIREAALRLHSQQLPAATQLAMTAGLVARFDWPEPLMSKTLPKHRQQFRSVSCDLVPFLIGRLVPRLQSLAASCSTGAAPSCDIWCTVLYTKCCTHLISTGLASLSTPSGDNSPTLAINCIQASHLLSGRHAGEALLQSLLQELPQRALAAAELGQPTQAASPRELGATLTLLAVLSASVLRLQAARLAHSSVDQLELDANAFQPHAADCFSGLAGLLAQVRSDQAQVHLLTVVASFL